VYKAGHSREKRRCEDEGERGECERCRGLKSAERSLRKVKDDAYSVRKRNHFWLFLDEREKLMNAR